MGVVRLGPDGEVDIIDPSSPEEEAEANEKLLSLARALARVAARREYARAVEETRSLSAASSVADEAD